MIKIKKGHGTFRGLPSEIFTDLRGICAGVRSWLTEFTAMDANEVERFLDNAVLSSRTEEWNKALNATKRSEDEIFEELADISTALRAALKELDEIDKCGCECCECKCEEESNEV